MNCFLYTLLFCIVLATTQNGARGNDKEEKFIEQLKTFFTKENITANMDKFCEDEEDPLKSCHQTEEQVKKMKLVFSKSKSNKKCPYMELCTKEKNFTEDNAECFEDIEGLFYECHQRLKSSNEENEEKKECCALEVHRNCLKKIADDKFGPQFACAVVEIHKKYSNESLEGCNDCTTAESSSSTKLTSVSQETSETVTSSTTSSSTIISDTPTEKVTSTPTVSPNTEENANVTSTPRVSPDTKENATPKVSPNTKNSTAIPIFANSIVILVACLGVILY